MSKVDATNGYEARAANALLKWLIGVTSEERDIYVLGCLLYYIEKDIINSNYQEPNKDSELYIRLRHMVERCKIYGVKCASSEVSALYNVYDGNVDRYIKDYCDKKGRIPLNNTTDDKHHKLEMTSTRLGYDAVIEKVATLANIKIASIDGQKPSD